MAVIYLFDSKKNLRRMVRKGVKEIIHNEGEYTATAQILSKDKPAYGDHFGFMCADGRFRMFLVNVMEITDETKTCTITGTDAAIAELEGSVLETLPMNETTAIEAATGALRGTGWQIGATTGDGTVRAPDAYFTTVWAVLKTISAAAKVRVEPYFEFATGKIVGRKVDILDRTPVFRGMIYTRRRGAKNIHIIKEGIPYGRVYPVGKIIGSGDPPERLTIAEAVWSTAGGKPVNKPQGQLYIDYPGAISAAAYVFTDNREEDPNELAQKAYEDLEKKQQPKATGTATVGQMQRMPGYAPRAIERGELVVVRTEEGDSVEATATNVERYYVHGELTKISIGEQEDATFEEYIARLTDSAEANAAAAGGAGAGARENKQLILNATELIQLNSQRIELNAQQILLRATITDLQDLEGDISVLFSEVYIDMDALEAKIELKASQTVVNNLTNQVTEMSATLTIQAEMIESRVEKNGVISAINQTAEEIRISANRINLDGYVTASQLQATNAQITNLMSGLTAATVLETNLLNAQQANVTYLSANALNLADISMQIRTVSMGDVLSHRFLVESATGDISLQHSHAVTVNETTGQVQLGEVSATGGNFNIADTQFFKDAVAAAGGDFTLTAAGWISNGENIVTAKNSKTTKTLAVKLPDFQVSGGDTWASNKTTVYFSTQSVSVPLKSVTVDASSIYTNGKNAVTLSAAGWVNGENVVKASNGKTTTVKLPAFTVSGGTVWSNKKTTVNFSTASVSTPLKSLTVDASSVYTDGYNAGYNDAWAEAMDSVEVVGSIRSIRNTAANTFFAEGSARAYLGNVEVASDTFTKTQTINVGQ